MKKKINKKNVRISVLTKCSDLVEYIFLKYQRLLKFSKLIFLSVIFYKQMLEQQGYNSAQ